MPKTTKEITQDFFDMPLTPKKLWYSEDEIKLLQDDTFIRMDKQMLKKFKEFCKATADNSALKTASPKLKLH